MSLKIDSHQHFWKYDPVKLGWIGEEMAKIRTNFYPEDLEPLLKKSGMDGSILVQVNQSEDETDFLLKIAGENDFVKGVVGWVDLTGPIVGERLKNYKTNPLFKGVRHTVWDKQGEFLLNLEFQRGIAALENLNLTYDLLVFDYQLPGAVKLTEKFPDQKFVLDHMGKPKISSEGPSGFWKENFKKLAVHENVFCKISGLVTEAPNLSWSKEEIYPFLDIAVSTFGINRLMFGSDWPVCLSAASYREVLEIVKSYFLDPEDLAKVLGGNAVSFYNLQNF